MNSQRINYQKNMSEINCESKHTCFYTKSHATPCPVMDGDIKSIGIYSPPSPKAAQQKGNKDDVFYLDNTVEINSSPDDKSIHVSVRVEKGVWKIGLIPGYAENKKLDALYASEAESRLLKICRETKIALTRRKSALRICKSVLAHQENFFYEGIAFIVPMSVLDVALDVSLDESCVSRYTHKIILHTPHGLSLIHISEPTRRS